MQTITESTEVYLRTLDAGSILDVETRNHRYKIEYLGGDDILISGHPSLCPAPVSAVLRGSLLRTGEVQDGLVGRGLRLTFRRLTDELPVVTSPIQNILLERA